VYIHIYVVCEYTYLYTLCLVDWIFVSAFPFTNCNLTSNVTVLGRGTFRKILNINSWQWNPCKLDECFHRDLFSLKRWWLSSLSNIWVPNYTICHLDKALTRTRWCWHPDVKLLILFLKLWEISFVFLKYFLY
jgi:hypothetical protein